jgi:hypothetical protein
MKFFIVEGTGPIGIAMYVSAMIGRGSCSNAISRQKTALLKRKMG